MERHVMSDQAGLATVLHGLAASSQEITARFGVERRA
jgi:hypothetical protein